MDDDYQAASGAPTEEPRRRVKRHVTHKRKGGKRTRKATRRTKKKFAS